MQPWRSIDGARTRWTGAPSVVTVGNFDGVHRGHCRVLERARELARVLGEGRALPVLAVTFDPHPTRVFAPDRAPAQLTSVAHRAALLRAAGADGVFVLAFDEQMAAWQPEEFVERILVQELSARGVVVGENFRFGAKAAGDVLLLRRCGERLGFDVVGLELAGGAEPWSSTYVRARVAEGDVAGAADALGRLHVVAGTVVEGDRRGRQMGFPTANVPVAEDMAVPADGVYAGWLRRCDDRVPLPAAISVGTNPTFDGVTRQVEAFVLDRDDLDLYGVPVEVMFVDWVRGQVRFSSMSELVDQMEHDVAAIRGMLAEERSG